jgi:hypothetical protein
MSSPPSNLDLLRRMRRMPAFLTLSAPLAAVLLAAGATAASAQEPPPNCPPGSWFCADAEKPAPKGVTPAPTVTVTKGGTADKAELEPLPPADGPPGPPPPPPAPPTVIYRNGPPPPPVVIYQPPPPGYKRPPPPPPPPPYKY